MRRVSVFVIVVIVAAVMLPLAAGTGAAQGFATNTPPPPTRTPLALATNTPPPPITTPAAPLGRYALRAWSEADLVTTLTAFVGRLRPGDSDGQRIVTLLQHELRRRFPAAPRDPEARRALLHALLAAPPASVDVRAIARPHIAALLAQHDARPGAAFSADGFMIEVLPAALTGPDANDALVHVRYPDDPLAPARYVDYLLARADADGRLTLLESVPPLPAAPLDSITDLMLLGVNDYNHDGMDEVMLSAAVAGDINRRLYAYGARGGQAVSLVEPGREIVYGTLQSSPAGSGIRVDEHRVESELWNCLSQRRITWMWQQNFWRPQADSAGFTLQPTTACRFYDSGPYYDLPPGDAITRLDAIIALVPPQDSAAIAQAQVIKAMLYALEGQPEIAAAQMRAARDTDASVTAQVDAFFAAAAAPDARPIHLCAALQQASPAACDVDLVLARLFTDTPLRRDQSVTEQLAERGITVQESLPLAQVGRAARELVRFDLGGERWWAFAPLDPDVYTAERSAPYPGAAAASPTPPPALLEAAPAVVSALVNDNDPARALNLLETALSRSPGAALSAAAQYMRAYSYDLLGDRVRARDGYFALWQSAPRSPWGQLAAAHLEQR